MEHDSPKLLFRLACEYLRSVALVCPGVVPGVDEKPSEVGTGGGRRRPRQPPDAKAHSLKAVTCLDTGDDGLRYQDDPRSEVAAVVPPGRVLDVGCSRGAFGQQLKRLCPSRAVFGIEPTAAAEHAKARLDGVVKGWFPEDLPKEWGKFDVLCFNDVLEHVVDPWGMLRASAPVLAPGGVVVASIPNVRYINVLLDLVVHGDWKYEQVGVLDRTHLRFFTKRSLERLFTESGFVVNNITPIRLEESQRKGARLVRALRLGPCFADILAQRYLVLAHMPPNIDYSCAQTVGGDA